MKTYIRILALGLLALGSGARASHLDLGGVDDDDSVNDHGGGVIVTPLPGEDGGDGPVITPIPGIGGAEHIRIHCASSGYRFTECHVGRLIVGGRLIRQLSHSGCREGRTFGFFDDMVWVNQGCRAIFDVELEACGLPEFAEDEVSADDLRGLLLLR